MPQLSDSMDEGKLISWKKKVGQSISVGEVIAEVESDKAIMEVQSFKAGVLESVLVEEDETVAVGTVIAKIDTGAKEREQKPQPQETKEETKKELVQEVVNKAPKEEATTQESVKKLQPQVKHISKAGKNSISPKARAKAASYGLEIESVMRANPEKTIHEDDLELYIEERYFSAKAKKLLQEYQLKSSVFNLDHKIDSEEVLEYIDTNEIPLPKPLTPMQKAIISNVTNSAQKPIFHIYETIDASLFEKHHEHSITVWLIKIFAKVMMTHEAFRSKLLQNALSVVPNASIALAVADDKDLFMPVVENANRLTATQIQERLTAFKEKLKAKSFSQNDMQGSTFGISNLGMLGVERFDAMINKEDSATVAVGAIINGKISLTLTADHRLINGYEAALFMNDVKKEAQEALNFKE